MKTKRWHINNKGEAGVCTARPGNCQFGDESLHQPTAELARERFEESMKEQLLKTHASSITDALHKNNTFNLPDNIITQLGGLLESKPYKPLYVTPIGSMLYNTQLSNRPVHDYDFTVFVTPHQSFSKGFKQTMQGELDVNFVPVDKLSDHIRRSSTMSETLYARKAGIKLYDDTNNPWSSFINSFHNSPEQYFDLMDDTRRSHYLDIARVLQKTPDDDKALVKPYKHIVRFNIYQKRWSDFSDKNYDYVDPRLSKEERIEFLQKVGSMREDLKNDPNLQAILNS